MITDTRGYIEITGVNLADFVRACYAPSRPQGLGAFHYQPGDLDDEAVAAIVERGQKDRMCAVSMDYVRGRSIKMSVYRGPDDRLFINNDWYDHSRPMLARMLSAVGFDGEKLIADAVADQERKDSEEIAIAEAELPRLLTVMQDGRAPYDAFDGFCWRTRPMAEKRGLIEYVSDPDHRKSGFDITDAGRALLQKAEG